MTSKTSADGSPDDGGRRDRAAIAVQACQTCRNRKSKCDEQRPKCGLCTRLGVDCAYREPQPTKKDKTLVHILNILERVELKVDRLSTQTPATTVQSEPCSVGPQSYRTVTDTDTPWDQVDPETRQQEKLSNAIHPLDLVSESNHLTAAHRILVWPAVFLLLTNARVPVMKDIHHIMQVGTPWFTHLELQKHSRPLPLVRTSTLLRNSPAPLHSLANGTAGLTTEDMRLLVDAYFDTFNILFPILDRDSFYAEILAPVLRGGYEDRDTHVCLAMLVMALGKVAQGATTEEQPGLELFNGAQRRFGFIVNSCTLENVQMNLLMATYFGSCARHMEFWRSCAAASVGFQVYMRYEQIDWRTPHADLIKRVYWTCILNEDFYHHELDLPRTGIYTLQDQIPLPSFERPSDSKIVEAEVSNYNHAHFLAMIALRRLISRIHASVHSDDEKRRAEVTDEYKGPPTHMINELASQLESWRTYLPLALQWSDAAMHSSPSINPLARRGASSLFTVQDTGDPGLQRYNLDIVTAHLRTRFYYARYMIYRPLVFKALHFPEAMTEEDNAYCALAIQSACMWPIAMSPCRHKKRLIPHLFTWTQNFLGILLILRMTSESECLRKICEERVSMRDMQATIGLLLDWIADVKGTDGVAEWSWTLIDPLFRGWA